MQQPVLVTGGAGYVGAVLVPKLLDAGHRVRVPDLYIYSQVCFQVESFRSSNDIAQKRLGRDV